MGEIVNLRRARKRLAAAQDEARSAANRIAFGVSKSEKSKAAAEHAISLRRIEAHRLTEARDDD